MEEEATGEENEAVAYVHPLVQVPVLDTVTPPQGGGDA